jgi:hypothetical protein
MKRVVSVSLGSSTRDHKASVNIMGETFEVERIGTDGDMDRAIEMIKELDGKVDAFGMGGIDLYLNGGNKKYVINDARPIRDAAKVTPMLDGTFIKNTLERKVIKYIRENGIVDFRGKNTLMVCGLDRFGMAEALIESGAVVTFGDAIFSIGWNLPIHSMRFLHVLAGIIAPIVCRMPFEKIYPTGKGQEQKDYKYVHYFYDNEIIAGDFIYIKKYMPDEMDGKIVITNTVTANDVADLKNSGAKMLITTTPEIDGRSFGTNVVEAMLTVASGKKPDELKEEDYGALIDKIGLVPRVEYLNKVDECAID